jgi:cell division protein ZapA (FtsZ GTPase activity inhibitor)
MFKFSKNYPVEVDVSVQIEISEINTPDNPVALIDVQNLDLAVLAAIATLASLADVDANIATGNLGNFSFIERDLKNKKNRVENELSRMKKRQIKMANFLSSKIRVVKRYNLKQSSSL